MNEKWNHRDLRLTAEKRRIGETSTIKEEWSRHVVDLKKGEEIKWSTRGGFHRTPYSGPHRFTFLEAGTSLRLKVADAAIGRLIMLGEDDEWTSEWYEADGWQYKVSLRTAESLYAVSELPGDKRTMQQTDHDAWEYAVRNGLI